MSRAPLSNPRLYAGLDCVRRRLGRIDGRQRRSVGLLHFPVHHQDRIGTGADHALDSRSDKNIAQEVLSVGAHDHEVRSRGCGSPQIPSKASPAVDE